MEMTKWDYNKEKDRAAEDVTNKKHADLRDMVFEERHDYFLINEEFEKVKSELAALKAAHAWIKTSERMPEPGVKVLVLCTDSSIDGEARIAKYYRNDDGTIEWSDDSFDSAYSDIDSKHVVAWMPLLGRSR